MIRYYRLARVACLTLFSLLIPQFSLADYIGRDPSIIPGGTKRVRDNGTLAFFYDGGLPQSIRDQIETYGEAHAVSPDLTKVYDFVNTLGFSNFVIGSNIDTGQYSAANTFSTYLCCSFPEPSPNGSYIFNAKQPLIHANDLYVISGEKLANGSYTTASSQIKHYNLTTNTFVDSIVPTAHELIDDIAWRPSGASTSVTNLFTSSQSGISHAVTFAGQTILSTPIIPGARGNLAIGTDDRLYVRNFANGDVERYNPTTGAFIDAFISHTNYPNLGTIQFGVDGNLHAYGGAGDILKFSASTGALLTTTHTNLINGRITYVPVPEPAGVMLALAGAVLLVGRRGKNSRR
jgi:hypothetical protein